VEWADYGCPHCALAAQELPELIKQMPNVQLRFKVFPLSGLCNPALESQEGGERCQAAAAAECARGQDKFYELQHLIFVNQTNLSDSELTFMAKQVGLDMDAWTACFEGQEVWEGIRADAEAGLRAGVMGTPAMFLKGTHGDTFIELHAGAAGAFALIQAQQNGTSLPPPGPHRGR
jgi:protein-disulfide isomerase